MLLTGEQLRLVRAVDRGRNPPADDPTFQELRGLGLLTVDGHGFAALTEAGRAAADGPDDLLRRSSWARGVVGLASAVVTGGLVGDVAHWSAPTDVAVGASAVAALVVGDVVASRRRRRRLEARRAEVIRPPTRRPG